MGNLKAMLLLLFLLVFVSCGQKQFDHALNGNHSGRLKMILTFRPGLAKVHDEQDRNPLHTAALMGHPDILNILIDMGSDLHATDAFGFTPLHLAVKMGNLEATDVLIKAGSCPNARTEYGQTPLHWAAMQGYEKIVHHLILAGADPFQEDKNGNTPADVADGQGYWRIAQMLYPLHEAARKGDIARIQSLLADSPSLIHIKDQVGRTALHEAMRRGQREAAAILVNIKGSLDQKDRYGFSPTDYHKSSSNPNAGIRRLDTVRTEAVDYTCYEALGAFDYLKVAMVENQEIVFSKAYGPSPLDDEDVWGSVSKPVTAMLMMHLVSIGIIESIDDPIWKYASKYQNSMPKAFSDDSVTIRHLLTHTSGIPHNNEPTWKNGKLNLKFKPGTRDQYSTPGYGVLGHVIEGATGVSFNKAVQKYIGEVAVASSFWTEDHFRAPGARVHSTIEDMARFSMSVMKYDYVSDSLFHHVMIPPINGPTGMGWGVQYYGEDDLTVFHGGSNGYPQAYLQIKPLQGKSVSILARAKNPHTFKLIELAVALMRVLEGEEVLGYL